MLVPFLLLIASASATVAAVIVWGPVLSGPLLFSALCVVAALLLLISARLRRQLSYIIVDGSNVMHWDGQTPALETVGRVVEHLAERGFTPVVWFDANVGYLVSDRYMGPDRLASWLAMSSRRVFVAPKGTPADPLLLDGAAHLQARVVTNDRFRDWTDDHPMIQEPGFLVRGEIENGSLTLELGD